MQKKRIKRVLLVTDAGVRGLGLTNRLELGLKEAGIKCAVYDKVVANPTIINIEEARKLYLKSGAQAIIAFGGGSAMDAGKIMWVLYEHPEADFQDMAMRFVDIRKRVYGFPKMGEKAYFVAVPTSAGTGSEVTPFAVITDEKTGVKYPLADYELMPKMAIVDADMMICLVWCFLLFEIIIKRNLMI